MSVKNFITSFLLVFCISFIVSVVVSYLYSLIAHGTGSIDWALSFRNGIIFGIILALVDTMNQTKKQP